jgi:hypothetical protein
MNKIRLRNEQGVKEDRQRVHRNEEKYDKWNCMLDYCQLHFVDEYVFQSHVGWNSNADNEGT